MPGTPTPTPPSVPAGDAPIPAARAVVVAEEEGVEGDEEECREAREGAFCPPMLTYRFHVACRWARGVEEWDILSHRC